MGELGGPHRPEGWNAGICWDLEQKEPHRQSSLLSPALIVLFLSRPGVSRPQVGGMWLPPFLNVLPLVVNSPIQTNPELLSTNSKFLKDYYWPKLDPVQQTGPGERGKCAHP